MSKIEGRVFLLLIAASLSLNPPFAFAKERKGGMPSGFQKGEKKGWEGEVPPGWSRGEKRGWGEFEMPPGLEKKRFEAAPAPKKKAKEKREKIERKERGEERALSRGKPCEKRGAKDRIPSSKPS